MTSEARKLLNEKLGQEPGRESFAGYHMFQYYTENPYGWYLRYVRGLQPLVKKPALIKGANIHDTIEILYKTGATEDVSVYRELCKKSRSDYELEKNYLEDLEVGLHMLKTWASEWLEHDLRTYTILSLEEQHTLPLSNGFKLTVRPDVVFQRKADRYIVALDHKTTTYSPTATARTFEASDQATAYLWALNKLYPKNEVEGIVCDVLYKRQSKCEATRPVIVQRRNWYLAQWELQAIGQLTEIAQKVQALSDGWPPTMLFPRNGKDESFFSHEWKDIYQSPLPSDPTEAPDGYYVDTWAIDRIYEMSQEILSLDVTQPEVT